MKREIITQKELDILKEVENAARAMPVRTLIGGGSGDATSYTIENGKIWRMSQLLNKLDKIRKHEK